MDGPREGRLAELRGEADYNDGDDDDDEDGTCDTQSQNTGPAACLLALNSMRPGRVEVANSKRYEIQDWR